MKSYCLKKKMKKIYGFYEHSWPLSKKVKTTTQKTPVLNVTFFIDEMITELNRIKLCGFKGRSNYTYYLLNMCYEKIIIIFLGKSF